MKDNNIQVQEVYDTYNKGRKTINFLNLWRATLTVNKGLWTTHCSSKLNPNIITQTKLLYCSEKWTYSSLMKLWMNLYLQHYKHFVFSFNGVTIDGPHVCNEKKKTEYNAISCAAELYLLALALGSIYIYIFRVNGRCSCTKPVLTPFRLLRPVEWIKLSKYRNALKSSTNIAGLPGGKLIRCISLMWMTHETCAICEKMN